MNRKLRRAGLAARGLDEAIMCQMAEDGVTVTRGRDAFVDVPTVETVALAHGERRWRPLTDRLESVGRWERDDKHDGWWVHDYLEFNKTRVEWDSLIERRRRGGTASAQARASARAPTHVEQVLQHPPQQTDQQKQEHPVEHSVEHDLQPFSFKRSKESSSSNRFNTAVNELAKKRLESTTSQVNNHEAWLTKTRRSMRTELEPTAQAFLAAHPEATVEELIAYLEPTQNGAKKTPESVASERAQRAQQQLAEQAHLRRDYPCPGCDGTGQILDDEKETAHRCTVCEGKGYALEEEPV